LRPETSQGIFTNFKNLYRLNNKRLPLAVAQIGKSFRNEISPKSGLVRQREFLVAEIEHFMHPDNKLKQFEKFKSVQDVQVNLVGKQNPVETIKMKLNDAISNVKIKFFQ
jgi:glycyl-tRNA synthetase